MQPFKVERQVSDRTVRILVRGELDMDTGPRLESELREVEADEPAMLVLDLREVSFFDSTGLQLVLDADVRAREQGRRFVVLPGEGEPLRVLELADVVDRLQLQE
ncbi:MAG TPA: STAS domain-containing protein [Solirubrobacter sp.]|nr:STAS domain-containing protein [Solirubrobacter sp.]